MTARVVTTDDVQTRLPELLALISYGYEIIIEADSRPVAQLVGIPDSVKKRIPGLNRGEIWTSDDFDEPLPDEFWTGEK